MKKQVATCGCGKHYTVYPEITGCWQCTKQKHCPKCKTAKAVSEFSWSSNADRPRSHCKSCRATRPRPKHPVKASRTEYVRREPKFDSREDAMRSHRLSNLDRKVFEAAEPHVKRQLEVLNGRRSGRGRGGRKHHGKPSGADAVLKDHGVCFTRTRARWLRISQCLLDVAHLEGWADPTDQAA